MLKEINPSNFTEAIDKCGATGIKALDDEGCAEEYRSELLGLLKIMKDISADDIKAADYSANIENTLQMDRVLIGDTVSEELDQLSLLITVTTYIACKAEGLPEHSGIYMDRVTALRKIIENLYDAEAMRFCGSDGC